MYRPRLSSALKSLPKQSRFAPVRFGKSKNISELKPVRSSAPWVGNKENVEDSNFKDKPSIRERMEALAQPSDHVELTHPSSSGSSFPHISSREHPNLKSQTSSRLFSAPALTGSSTVYGREPFNDRTEDCPSVHRSFVHDILSFAGETKSKDKPMEDGFPPSTTPSPSRTLNHLSKIPH